MNIDPKMIYMMPMIMGPIMEQEHLPKIKYPDIETVALQFKSDPSEIRNLLPDSYSLGAEPLVNIVFGYNKGLDFMAGGGYRIAAFQVSARFDGEQDHLEGDYILVMFENQTRPILGGREHLGVPKIYADISPIKRMPNGNLRCEASMWGHLLFGIEIAPMKRQNPIIRAAASKRINDRPWLAYKYIPSLDGPPDADYPTITRNDVKVDYLELGKAGELYFGSATEEDVATTAWLMDALRGLSVQHVQQTLRLRGSAVLRYDQSRRLK